MKIGGKKIQERSDFYKLYKTLPNPFKNSSHSKFRWMRGFFSKKNLTDKTAYFVDEAEYGISKLQKLGTKNLHDCVAMVARDQASGLTLLTHIDSKTNLLPLEDVWKNFPESSEIDITLIGASLRGQNGSKNIEKVLNFLGDKNVNIHQAFLLSKESPSEFIIDPVTGKLTPDRPGNISKNRAAISSLVSLMGSEYPIREAFDLLKTIEYTAITLTPSDQKKLLEKNIFNFGGRKAAKKIIGSVYKKRIQENLHKRPTGPKSKNDPIKWFQNNSIEIS